MKQQRWLWIVVTVFVLAAAAGGFWFWRGKSSSSVAGRPVPTPDFDVAATPAHETSVARPDDMLISLPPEKLANASFKIEAVQPAMAAPTSGGLRAVGTVQSNPYKETPVMPIAGGIVRAVNVTLGEQVTPGQTLATLFSTELSEAQTAYLKVQAEIEKHHKHFRRAADLVELGAISREEYEDTQSQYKTEQAELGAARQRLVLYGLTAKQIDALQSGAEASALITITAPVSGLVLNRLVNPGEVVNMGKELFRLADLSTVWVIGQVYEQDLARVRVGTAAAITAAAYPQRRFTGRVSYIDPRIEPQTRTAQVRIEVGNAGQPLKLGMFVDVNFGGDVPTRTEANAAVSVPQSAVQLIGTKPVVFVATAEAGGFAQRAVQAGPAVNGVVPVFDGLSLNDRVVTEGSFLLRAESLKLDPAQTREAAPEQRARADQHKAAPADKAATAAEIQTATVVLNEKGYQPGTLRLRPGIRARVTFLRKVEATCGTEIVLADYGIKRALPLGQPVTIEFTPAKPGEFKFSCGMDMLQGSIVVK
ncbi:MAG: efflux RND transporter periplasmic adaptor subunit [Acidobacteria bacterium]|nr:efflux RND transporter periplasmic adaptor subunit [Acidobacteriota bacterium]MBI3422072.1 efflux RND transporter periplasmic adaptor subunit [Acidobacteriota bacterium]